MTKSQEAAAPERWRDIPGFGGIYQASTEGRSRRVWSKSGKTTILRPYTKSHGKNSNRSEPRLNLTLPDGRRKTRTVLKLVAETFYENPEGLRAVHANGLHADASARNIAFLSDRELGKRFGGNAKRRPVAKITPDGHVIACYPSARAAARENYMSYQTVVDRCNRKVKKEFALDGFSYRWDD